MRCELVCSESPCFCWGDAYPPAEDTWLAWELLERLPRVGGLGADVGAGSCALMNVLKEKVDFAVGIDVNPCAAEACRRCSFEALLCDSLTCLRRPVRLAVANLPYLPCADDPATCWEWGKRVLRGLRVEEGGYLVLVWSSLTPGFELEGFELIELREVKLGFETLYGGIFRRASRAAPSRPSTRRTRREQ
ncbi:MAG: hypothetical protein GXO07_00495 [Crenarchaeota archaeon]|nr:hypothetical protein [Thermoproteota archaeon]